MKPHVEQVTSRKPTWSAPYSSAHRRELSGMGLECAFQTDIASLLPTTLGTKRLVPGAITVILTAWLFGLIWALLYNRWT